MKQDCSSFPKHTPTVFKHVASLVESCVLPFLLSLPRNRASLFFGTAEVAPERASVEILGGMRQDEIDSLVAEHIRLSVLAAPGKA